MCSLSKKQSILPRETIQNVFFFFFRIMPLSQLKSFYPLLQAPHSRALAPTCSALVFLSNYVYYSFKEKLHFLSCLEVIFCYINAINFDKEKTWCSGKDLRKAYQPNS